VSKEGDGRRRSGRGRGEGGREEEECAHLAVVVEREAADELPVLGAGYFEFALELEEEEL
jgi:hypothetical protein